MKYRIVGVLVMLASVSASANPLRLTPKAELHLHLTGAYPVSYLEKIATPTQMDDIRKSIEEVSKGVVYQEAFEHFKPIERVVNTYEKVEYGMRALCEALLRDGVIYAEIRTGLKDLSQASDSPEGSEWARWLKRIPPGGMLKSTSRDRKGMLFSPEERYLRAVLDGARSCSRELGMKFLLSIRRDTPEAKVKQTIDLAIKYRGQGGVVGIDVSGFSGAGSTLALAQEILRAKDEGLLLALHVGESPDEIGTRALDFEQAQALELLKPDRIGHGVHLSEGSKKWLQSHPQVPIEVCPSSSVLAGMVTHFGDHPGLEHFKSGKYIVVGSDDPLLFNTTLSAEYGKLIEAGFEWKEILKLIDASFDFAFLTPAEKEWISIRRLRSKL